MSDDERRQEYERARDERFAEIEEDRIRIWQDTGEIFKREMDEKYIPDPGKQLDRAMEITANEFKERGDPDSAELEAALQCEKLSATDAERDSGALQRSARPTQAGITERGRQRRNREVLQRRDSEGNNLFGFEQEFIDSMGKKWSREDNISALEQRKIETRVEAAKIERDDKMSEAEKEEKKKALVSRSTTSTSRLRRRSASSPRTLEGQDGQDQLLQGAVRTRGSAAAATAWSACPTPTATTPDLDYEQLQDWLDEERNELINTQAVNNLRVLHSQKSLKRNTACVLAPSKTIRAPLRAPAIRRTPTWAELVDLPGLLLRPDEDDAFKPQEEYDAHRRREQSAERRRAEKAEERRKLEQKRVERLREELEFKEALAEDLELDDEFSVPGQLKRMGDMRVTGDDNDGIQMYAPQGAEDRGSYERQAEEEFKLWTQAFRGNMPLREYAEDARRLLCLGWSRDKADHPGEQEVGQGPRSPHCRRRDAADIGATRGGRSHRNLLSGPARLSVVGQRRPRRQGRSRHQQLHGLRSAGRLFRRERRVANQLGRSARQGDLH